MLHNALLDLCGRKAGAPIDNGLLAHLYFHNLHYEKMPDGTVKCIEDEIPFELPEGWEWTRLQSICEPITDGTHKTPTYSDEGFIFLSSKNVTSGHIDWNNIMYIPEFLHNELYARLAPQKNDIHLAKNGTTGVAAIVDRDCVFDIYVSLALLRIIGYIIFPEYLLSTIASSTIQNYFNSSLKGIGVPTPSFSASCFTNRKNISSACSSMSARYAVSLQLVSRFV